MPADQMRFAPNPRLTYMLRCNWEAQWSCKVAGQAKPLRNGCMRLCCAIVRTYRMTDTPFAGQKSGTADEPNRTPLASPSIAPDPCSIRFDPWRVGGTSGAGARRSE